MKIQGNNKQAQHTNQQDKYIAPENKQDLFGHELNLKSSNSKLLHTNEAQSNSDQGTNSLDDGTKTTLVDNSSYPSKKTPTDRYLTPIIDSREFSELVILASPAA